MEAARARFAIIDEDEMSDDEIAECTFEDDDWQSVPWAIRGVLPSPPYQAFGPRDPGRSGGPDTLDQAPGTQFPNFPREGLAVLAKRARGGRSPVSPLQHGPARLRHWQGRLNSRQSTGFTEDGFK